MKSLDGKVAVVTGGASGIGYALAERFAADGARIVIADIEVEPLDRAVSGLTDLGADVIGVRTDVGDRASVAALADDAFAHFGAVHVVCNNAGALALGRIWELDDADWDRVMRVNFGGVLNGVRTFVPRLIDQGEPAHIVNTASMAGVMSLPHLGPYVASKHAVVGLSEVLAIELANSGAPIGVSVVCPGLVATRLGRPDRLGAVEPMAGAMSAADVAAKVRVAMAEGQFYVFTHDDSERYLRRRLAGMLDGSGPVERRP